MIPFLRESYGNPSSIHHFGQEAKKAIEVARENLANLIHARPPEIVFTGGGTEADNLAIKGVAYASRSKGSHLITSSVEHHAVLHSCRHLEKDGFHVTYLPVDSRGRVNPDDMKKALRRDTILVTIMHSNNEVGTLQSIETLGKIAHEHGVLFHTDSIQSIGKILVDVERLGVDLLSISGHKFYGPKGVGALYVKDGVTIECQTHGGSHEMKRRAGTENVAGIVGLGKAAELASMEIGESQENIRILRDYFWDCIQGHRPGAANSDPVQSLPNTLRHLRLCSRESVVINLDLRSVCFHGSRHFRFAGSFPCSHGDGNVTHGCSRESPFFPRAMDDPGGDRSGRGTLGKNSKPTAIRVSFPLGYKRGLR
jgi:cysteine desulfurase